MKLNIIIATVFAFVITASAGLMPIQQTKWTTNSDPTVSSDGTGAQYGNGADASSGGSLDNGGVAVGVNANGTKDGTAVGAGSFGVGGVAIGYSALAGGGINTSEHNVAIGFQSQVNVNNPGGVTNAINIGTGYATNDNTFHLWGVPFATKSGSTLSLASGVSGGGGFPSVTAGVNYPLYLHITVSNSTLFPFLNGAWTYIPTNGAYTKDSQSIKTNFFYFDPAYNSAWQFATTRYPVDATTGVFEYDNDAASIFYVNQYSVSGFTRASDSASDGTKIYASTVPSQTNLSVVGSTTVIGSTGLQAQEPSLTLSNLNLNMPLVKFGQDGSVSSTFGSINLYGNSFGFPWTNTTQGFEAAKISGHVAGSTRGDDRFYSLVPYFKGNIGEYGAGMDFLVSRSSTYPTPNNQVTSSWLDGGWPWIRVFNIQNMGVEDGDCPTTDHEYGRWLPAWHVTYVSTNDRPHYVFTNQIPAGTSKRFKTTLPPASVYSDNTNLFVGGSLVATLYYPSNAPFVLATYTNGMENNSFKGPVNSNGWPVWFGFTNKVFWFKTQVLP